MKRSVSISSLHPIHPLISEALSEHFFFTPCLPIDVWSAQWAFLLYTLPAHWWVMRSVSISSLHPACPLMIEALSELFFFTPCLPIDDWSAQWAFLLYTLPAHWWLMRSVSISSLHPACPLMCEALSEHFAVPCFFLLPLTSAKRGCCCPLPVPQAAAPGHILQVHTYKWIDTWLFLVCLVCLVWVKRHSHWDSCTRSYPARTYGSTQAFSHPVIPCTYTRTWIDTSVFSPSHTLQVHTYTWIDTSVF